MRLLHLHLRAAILACILWAGPAQATSFPVASDILGTITLYKVKADENLYQIARDFDIGIVALFAANPGVDPWLPPEGTELRLPTAYILPAVRHGVVINLSELRLYYFDPAGKVMVFPIGIGRQGWETPTGTTTIINKRPNPIWTPPLSIRKDNPDLPAFVAAGPDNPLGDYAFYLGWKGYLIHGTNRPYGVGKRSSHGCIRLYPEDIETLFKAVPIGTQVTVIGDQYELGRQNGALYLSVSPAPAQMDALADYKPPEQVDIQGIYDAIDKAAGKDAEIDWYAVENAIMDRSGIPVFISRTQ